MFRKRTYSDLEIQEVMETLFREKKKVKELELKLKNQTLSPAVSIPENPEKEALLLQKQTELEEAINALHNRLESTQKENESLKHLQKTSLKNEELEKAELLSEQEALKSKLLILQKELEQFSKAHKSDEAQKEELLFGQEALKKQVLRLQEENECLKHLQSKALQGEENQKEELLFEQHSLKNQLLLLQKEMEQSAKALKIEEIQKEELLFEQQALKNQLLTLQKENSTLKPLQKELEDTTLALRREELRREEILLEELALKDQLQQLRSQLVQMQEHLSKKDAEKEFFNKETSDQKAALHQAQKETDLLKQMMMKTLQEFKEERLKDEEQYKSKISTLSSDLESHKQSLLETQLLLEEQREISERSQSLLLDKEDQINKLLEEAEGYVLAHKELAQFTEDLKANLLKTEEEKKSALEIVNKKEELVQNLSSQVASLARSLANLEESIGEVESERHEHESRFRVAQQHLAKKVREVALLAEQNEATQNQLGNLHSELESIKKKLLETESSLEIEKQQQRRMKEDQQESSKNLEAQRDRWEEKYFQIHERLQEIESRNKELVRLEERFGKLQTVLGQLLGPSVSLPEPSGYVEMEVIPKPAPASQIQTTLFESQKPAPRYKESLFG